MIKIYKQYDQFTENIKNTLSKISYMENNLKLYSEKNWNELLKILFQNIDEPISRKYSHIPNFDQQFLIKKFDFIIEFIETVGFVFQWEKKELEKIESIKNVLPNIKSAFKSYIVDTASDKEKSDFIMFRKTDFAQLLKLLEDEEISRKLKEQLKLA